MTNTETLRALANEMGEFVNAECAAELDTIQKWRDRIENALSAGDAVPADDELPGMWSSADLIGGKTDADAPAAPPAEVDEAMVERALAAFFDFYDKHGGGTGADGHAMRAALTAALGRKGVTNG